MTPPVPPKHSAPLGVPVPVLLLWVPVQGLRALLLCDSGSCASCNGSLLPLSAFLSKLHLLLLDLEDVSQVV